MKDLEMLVELLAETYDFELVYLNRSDLRNINSNRSRLEDYNDKRAY